MFDIYLRGLKDRMIDPIAGVFPLWLSPNVLTFCAFCVGIGSCVTASFPVLSPWALLLWSGNRLLDCLDGSVARQRKMATQLGGFLDLLSDFMIYSLIPICIAVGRDRSNPQDSNSSTLQSVNQWRSIGVLEASFHVNNFVLFYAAAISSKMKSGELTSVTMQPALIEGFESGVLFTLMFAFPEHLTLLSCIMAIGVFIGTLQRVTMVVRALTRVDTQAQRLGKDQ